MARGVHVTSAMTLRDKIDEILDTKLQAIRLGRLVGAFASCGEAMSDDKTHWPTHQKDSDCTVTGEDDDWTCTECGVWHGDPCPECEGRGFHNAGCSLSDDEVA